MGYLSWHAVASCVPHCSIFVTRQTPPETPTASSAIAPSPSTTRRSTVRNSDASSGTRDIALPPDAGEILTPPRRAAVPAAMGEGPPLPSEEPAGLRAGVGGA